MLVFIGPKRAEGSGSYLSLLHVEMTGSTFGMRLRERSINLRCKCVHSLLGGGFRAGSSRSTHNSIWVLTHRWLALLFLLFKGGFCKISCKTQFIPVSLPDELNEWKAMSDDILYFSYFQNKQNQQWPDPINRYRYCMPSSGVLQ